MKNNYSKIGKILSIVLEFMFILLLIIIVVSIPILKLLNIEIYNIYLFVYPIGIAFLVLMRQFISMFKSLKDKKVFQEQNIKKLSTSMKMSFIIFMLILIMIPIYIFKYKFIIGTLLFLIFIDILFLGVGIALYILEELFKEAINYKEENDLTI